MLVTRQICGLVLASYEDGTCRSITFQTTMDSQLPETDEEDLHLEACSKTVIVSVFACKLKPLANSRGSYPLVDMETSDNTLDHVHSIFIR